MKYLFALLLFLFFCNSLVLAQTKSYYDSTDYVQLYKSVLDEYGFDQVLANGIYYEDKYWKKRGHQFFPEDLIYSCTLTFRGKEYRNVGMKYDICDQQLVLYLKNDYLNERIVPSCDFVSTFSFNGKFFAKYDFRDGPKFYQVVFDSEKLKCLYYWYKQVHETDNSGNSSYYYYEFTDSKKKNYLELNGSFEEYRNNRTFTGLFPPEIKASLLKYIKKNHIKVASSSDERMIELLTYCNSLL